MSTYHKGIISQCIAVTENTWPGCSANTEKTKMEAPGSSPAGDQPPGSLGTLLPKLHPKPTPKTVGTPSLAYMHHPPTIMPNYGNKKKSSLLPKTKVSRVLLYDNMTQQQMLDVKLSHIKIERTRTSRLLDLHKRSFLFRQKKRQQQLQNVGIVLPEIESPESKKNDILQRLASEYSRRTNSSIHENKSAVDLETLKLPEVAPNNNSHHVIFKLKNASGITRIYHTLDDEGVFSDILPLHKFYTKTTEDPRFMGLEGTLVKTETETDGFNELSPSFRKVYPKLPDHLQLPQDTSTLRSSV